jgi:hypothetical protein
MSDSVQAFLAGIGPRPLTYEEASALQILRIKAGKGCHFQKWRSISSEVLFNCRSGVQYTSEVVYNRRALRDISGLSP